MGQSACLRALAAVTLLTVFVRLPSAQTAPTQSSAFEAARQYSLDRIRALQIYHAGKFVDAAPLLEKLAADHPSDGAVKEAWAFSVMVSAASLSDPELRKKARVRARNIALQAKQLPGTGSLLQLVLELPEDGSEPSFSNRREVDDTIRAAEADFARGDLDKAREGYLKAFLLDPQNYPAAVFIGDVYFKQHLNGSASEWFSRAVQIDPSRETAYRYWGDALSDLDKFGEAREKYIQAVIAAPYDKRSWMGLTRWTQRTHLALNWVRLQDKTKLTTGEKGATVTIDSSLRAGDPALHGWMIYSGTRVSWQKEKFKHEYPNEPKYRRTLREEVDALHTMASVLSLEDAGKLDPSLAALLRIDRAGFIEPFALLNRADNEIAQDYVPYRTANRDKIFRYMDEFVVPKAP